MVAVANFIDLLFRAYEFLILLRVLFSWIRPDPYNTIVRLVNQLTDPVMEPLRRVIPAIGMIDITPIVALILISIIEQLVFGLLVRL